MKRISVGALPRKRIEIGTVTGFGAPRGLPSCAGTATASAAATIPGNVNLVSRLILISVLAGP